MPTRHQACLKLPEPVMIMASLIPPIFVLGCALLVQGYGTRIGQMGDYLGKVERILGDPNGQWEKFNAQQRPALSLARRRTGLAIFVVCALASAIGSYNTHGLVLCVSN